MKNNLIKLLALTLVMGLFVGCSDDDETTPPAECVLTQTSATTVALNSGDYTSTCSASTGVACVATPATVATDVAGNFALSFTAEGCTDATGSVTVSANVTPPSDITPENILPN